MCGIDSGPDSATIRAHVNSHPVLSKHIQFNSLAGLSAVPLIGGLLASGADPANNSAIVDELRRSKERSQ